MRGGGGLRHSSSLMGAVCRHGRGSSSSKCVQSSRAALCTQSYADRLHNNPLTKHTKGFINGEWVDCVSGDSFEVNDPATGHVLCSVPDMTCKETVDAIEAANAAQTEWGRTDLSTRSAYLKTLHKLIQQNADFLAEIITLEAGKPLAESKGEVLYANSFVEWFAEEAKRISGLVSLPQKNGARSLTIRQPVGVCALVTPWNFPLAMITRKAAAALAAGCSVVIKPAEDTPITALALANLVQQAKLPAGVFNVVTTSRANVTSVGKELCENEKVRKISFTGSTLVGKELYRMATSTVKKVSLELGGNAPFIVFDSADVQKAVAGVVASKFRNCGQTCVCANRIFVQHKIYDEFCDQLTKAIGSMKLGHGLDPLTTHGPLINQKATEKVWAHVEDAINRGGHLKIGGKRADSLGPCFFQPTLLTHVDKDALVNSEETFGPLAAITRFESEEEVVGMANSVRVGLAGYIYSNNAAQIFRVSEALEVGMVGVNAGVFSADIVVFGGVKESGIGREGSVFGIEEYQELKYIHLNL